MHIPPVAFRPSADALLSGGDHRQGRRRGREQEGSSLEEEEAWDENQANQKTMTKTITGKTRQRQQQI